MSSASRYIVVGRVADGVDAEILDAVSVDREGQKRRVLIKRLRAVEDDETIDSFLDEARVLRQLRHPNIVRLLDAGVLAERAIIVFDFVAGLNLKNILDKARTLSTTMPEELAAYVVLEVARALEHAHRAPGLRVVHRDVTPSNVLVSWAGEVVLADFGIALFERRAARTEAGLVRGKLAYMSPEQLSGSDLDARTDVFSLGCVLHELLTGTSPLSDPARRDELLLGQALALDPSLSDPSRALLERLLEHDRRRRPRDGGELRELIEQHFPKSASKLMHAELARWTLTLIGATEPTRIKPAPMDETFEMTLTTQSVDRRDFDRTKVSSETISEVLSFIETTTKNIHPFEVPNSAEKDPALPPVIATPVDDTVMGPRSGRRPSRKLTPLTLAALILGLLASLVVVLAQQLSTRSAVQRAMPQTGTQPGPEVSNGGAPPSVVPRVLVSSSSSSDARARVEAETTSTETRVRPKGKKRKPVARARSEKAPALEPLDAPEEANRPTAELSSISQGLDLIRDALSRAKTHGVSASTLAPLERAYLDLSSEETEAINNSERERLLGRVRALHREVSRVAGP